MQGPQRKRKFASRSCPSQGGTYGVKGVLSGSDVVSTEFSMSVTSHSGSWVFTRALQSPRQCPESVVLVVSVSVSGPVVLVVS